MADLAHHEQVAKGGCGNAAVPGTSHHGEGLAVDCASSACAGSSIRSDGPTATRRRGATRRTSGWHITWRLGAWKGTPSPAVDPVLRRGQAGPSVRRLQRLLRARGFKRIRVTAYFGVLTVRAVRRVQRRRALPFDGVVGPRTWNVLTSGELSPRALKISCPMRGLRTSGSRRRSTGGRWTADGLPVSLDSVPSRAEIRDVARQALGASLAWTGTREYGLLERLLGPEETIEAMALGKLAGRLVAAQRLVLATPRRLLLVEKGFVTGHERVREISWAQLRAVAVTGAGGLTFELEGELIALTFVQPPRQQALLAELVRARLSPDSAPLRARFDELRELARRKLGRGLAFGVTPHLVVLADTLAPGETVLDVAWAGKDGSCLLVATPWRLLEIATDGMGAKLREQLELHRVRDAHLDEDLGLVVRHAGGELRWSAVVPADRALGLVETLRRRAA